MLLGEILRAQVQLKESRDNVRKGEGIDRTCLGGIFEIGPYRRTFPKSMIHVVKLNIIVKSQRNSGSPECVEAMTL